MGGTWYAAAPDGGKAEPGKKAGGKEAGGTEEDAGGEGAGSRRGGDRRRLREAALRRAKARAREGEQAEQADRPGLSVRKDPKLGEIIVDRNGMTVYRFTKDSAWPMKAACTGACLEKWPAVAPSTRTTPRASS